MLKIFLLNDVKFVLIYIKKFTMRNLFLTIGIFISLCANAQKIPISGIITDSIGTPVLAVTVMEKGTTNGTSTNEAGRFSLSVNPQATLVISSVGWKRLGIGA